MDSLKSQIESRYQQEAQTCDTNLSCGSNLKYAELKQGEIVLDLGCGRGKETLASAQVVGPSGKAIGLDLTPKMIEIARKNALDNKVDNVQFVSGDIQKLPFKAETIDIVISNCVINHVRDKLSVYKEIYRILKPNGRLVVSDIVIIDPLPEEIRKDEQAWADCFAGAEDREAYFNTIAKAGFTSVEILNWREYKKQGYLIASVTFKASKV